MDPATQKPPLRDAFISYSRKDEAFASKLGKALVAYAPPKDLKVPQRNLDIFRDKEDFTGTEYHQSLEKHLHSSAKLIVLCSPSARQSPYVNDEIRLFAKATGPEHIIPLLIAGLPNNEATPEQESEKAFPDALVECMTMPLAAEFRGFDVRTDKIDKGAFEGPWYTTLANIYGVSRSELEQREKKRQLHRQRVTIAVVISIMLALASLTVIAWLQRTEAIRQRDVAQERGKIALSRQLAAEARVFLKSQPSLAFLLAMEANRTKETIEAKNVLLEGLDQVHYPSRLLTGHHPTGEISLAFSPDSKFLTTTGWDGLITLWDIRDGREISRDHLDAGGVAASLGSTGKFQRFISMNGKLHVWDLARHKEITTIEVARIEMMGAAVMRASFSPAGRKLALVNFNKTISIVDLTTDVLSRRTFNPHSMIVPNIVFSQSGNMLAVIAGSQGTALWDVKSGKQLGVPFAIQERQITAAAISIDDTILATADSAGAISFWDIHTRKLVGSLNHPLLERKEMSIDAFAFSPDGKLLASGYRNGALAFWDLQTNEPISLIAGSDLERITNVLFSPDGQLVAVASTNGLVRVWDISKRHSLGNTLATGSTVFHSSPEFSVKFSPDSKILASVYNRKYVMMWDVKSRTAVGDPLGSSTGEVDIISFSPDGKFLASTGKDNTVIVWNPETRLPLAPPLHGHAGKIRSLAFSPDSKILASLSLDRTLRSWNFETGQPLPNSPITNIDETPTGLAFSPDGTTLAVSGSKGVTLRNPVTGEVLSSLIHSSMRSIAFSPNGKVLAGGDDKGAIVLWNMETRGLLGQILKGHTNSVYSVAISPDGQILASGSADRTVVLWDLATGQRIGPPLQGHATAVSGVVFSRDGKTLASSSMDETVILWDLDFESWRASACELAERNLTPGEWKSYLGTEAYHKTCQNFP